MPRQRDFAWTHCTSVSGTTKVKCNWCKSDITGGIYRFKWHLAKEPGNNITSCPACPADVTYQALQALHAIPENKAKKARTGVEIGSNCTNARGNQSQEDGASEFLRESGSTPSSTARGPNTGGGNVNAFFAPRTSPGSQTTLESTGWRKNVHEQARKAIGNFWYYSSLPFHVARSPYWQGMVDAIAAAGPGFKAPSYETLRVGMLNDAVEDVKDVLKEHKLEWAKTGCTIMSDGWTDRRNRTLINFLVSCEIGTIFLKSEDASDTIKSAAALFEMFDFVVKEVGPLNVVQFITDNAAACVAARRLLTDKYPSIFFTPCAAHCLDLTLEDIGKLEWVKEVLQKARSVTKFIYNHTRVLCMMRTFTEGKELVRPGVTRFATHFLALQTLCQQKMNLKRMFVSNEWMESGFSTLADGIAVADYIYSSSFWDAAEQVVEFSEPLVKVLRLVDGEKSPMGYLYEAMDRAKEVMRGRMQNDRDRYMPLWDMIDRRWDRQMHSPLHAAGYYLNPSLFYDPSFRHDDGEVSQGLFICMEKMFPIREQLQAAMGEIATYKQARGFLSSKAAIEGRNTLLPAQWWDYFGHETKHLRWMARRILSQPCSSSACERTWSVFEHIHSKKRNRLTQERMNDLVFVHHNLRLKLKKAQGTNEDDDPIDLDEIDPESEWIAADTEFLEPEDFEILKEAQVPSEDFEYLRRSSELGASSSRPAAL